jgi:ATP-dependent exoDNAse (exonuclease V) alpha subunit
MAILFLEKQHFSRGKGDSVCAAAAYRSGEVVNDYFYGEIHNYINKPGVVYSNIITPSGTDDEFSEREALWNIVEDCEHRIDARLANELRLALPAELTLAEHIPLVNGFVTDNLVNLGICADISIHDEGNGNPHSHVMYTMRNIVDGEFGVKNRDWDKKEFLMSLHKKWAEAQAKSLRDSEDFD